jgi:hypothetical protein
MASSILPTATAGVAVAVLTAITALSASPALAYTESPTGTYNVTSAELKAAFGEAAVLAEVTFDVESNFTWYSVPCKKTLPNNKKELTKTFKRQSHLTSIETVTPTATGFTVVVTGTELRSNVRCPGGFRANGAPTVLAQSTASRLVAEYREMDVELVKQ